MEYSIEVPEYAAGKGIEYKWENGFEIATRMEDGAIMIVANREGLISLANHLLNLAQMDVPRGWHMHFDESNSLEVGSMAMVIEKK